MKAKKGDFDFKDIKTKIETFYSIESHDNMALIKNLKLIVPEFKSQNSIYETLDKTHQD